MKIESIQATPVRIDFTEPEIWSQGRRFGATCIIVQVRTDTEIIGIGESVPAPDPYVTLAAIEMAARRLVGRDPRAINQLCLDLQYLDGWCSFPYVGHGALAGVEIACWDIAGKILGAPVHDLLGGKIRSRVPIMGFVQHKGPDEIETDARAMAAQGYTTLYTKLGLGMEDDVEAVEALRRGGGPKVELRVDPNESWTPGHAIRMAHAIAHLGVQYIEQPLRMRSIHELAVLRRRSPVPIGANQASWLNWDILDIVREKAADVIMTDPWQAGGIGNFQRAAAICETASLPMVYHSFAPLSIATRAAMTVLCSSSACIYANQTYHHMTADDVVREPVQIIDGHIEVIDRPGLGVEVDHDKLARYHEAFLSGGYASAYGNVDKTSSETFFIPNQ